MSAIRIAIVEDEPLARRKLARYLAAAPQANTLQVVGEAADADAAVALLRRTKPHLVFLDVEMPGGSGLDVLRRAGLATAVVFTTAFEHYAVPAFDLAAVDYLVKPFGRERFLLALDRARASLDGRAPHVRATYATRVFVRDRGDIRPVRVSAIQHVETADDFVIVRTGGTGYPLHSTMAELQARLDPSTFVRVHRRWLVNLEHVVTVQPADGRRLTLCMRDGTHVTASRALGRRLRDHFE